MPQYWTDFIVPAALASSADYTAWTGGTAPANITNLLRAATKLVQEATAVAYYDVDPLTGLATNAQTKKALNDATCIQAAAWTAMNYDPLTGGVMNSGVESATKIGTASITFADGALAAQAKSDAITGLVPEARRVLAQNNLLVPQAWAFG